MFTGIVKLAQVDDYINPGQSCIQPKIMKAEKEKEKASVSLNDCLACSGCLTSAESVLVQQMSVAKLMAQLAKPEIQQVHFLVAPQSVLSIARTHQISPEIVFAELSAFFRQSFKTGLVLDIYEGITHCQRLALQEYLAAEGAAILCSQCPGWVCYAEKTLPQSVVRLMSHVKSPQQAMAAVLKQRNQHALVVSIMPCYDKKLEAIRFEIEHGLKEVDITITTVELLELYATIKGNPFGPATHPQIAQLGKVDRLFGQNAGMPYQMVEDPVSNGYVQSLIRNLGGTSIQRRQVRNTDFIQYQFQTGGKKVKMAKCYGFRNIQKIVQAVKKGKCEYTYVEMMACPGGCFSGGGQIKDTKAKPKETWEEMAILAKPLTKQSEGQSEEGWATVDSKQLHATYKVIEKSLSQSVMNW